MHPWKILASIFIWDCALEKLNSVRDVQPWNAEFPIVYNECSKTVNDVSYANDESPIDTHETGKTTLVKL